MKVVWTVVQNVVDFLLPFSLEYKSCWTVNSLLVTDQNVVYMDVRKWFPVAEWSCMYTTVTKIQLNA